MPYNVNVLTQKMALEAVQNLEEKKTQVNEILIQKAILKKGLVRFEFVEKMYPSDANFFLLKVKNPQKLIHFLRGKGIIIRDRSKTILCENCVRISVGTNLENEQLLRALKLYNSLK
jgi:histidinol-phosphate aminotransferase